MAGFGIVTKWTGGRGLGSAVEAQVQIQARIHLKIPRSIN